MDPSTILIFLFFLILFIFSILFHQLVYSFSDPIESVPDNIIDDGKLIFVHIVRIFKKSKNK